MTDFEKQYAYEMQRRQTIGNFLSRASNLGRGNAAGVPFVDLSSNADDSTYSLEDDDASRMLASHPGTEDGPAKEDLDLDINPSEEDEFVFPE